MRAGLAPARLTRCPHSGQSAGTQAREPNGAQGRKQSRRSAQRAVARARACRARCDEPAQGCLRGRNWRETRSCRARRCTGCLRHWSVRASWRAGAADRYLSRLARCVRSATDFVDDEWITDIAAPLMAAFTAAHVWPVSADDVRRRAHADPRDHASGEFAFDRLRHGWTAPADAAHGGRSSPTWPSARRTNAAPSWTCSAIRQRPKTVTTNAACRRCCTTSAQRATHCRTARSIPRHPAFRSPIRGERLLGCMSMIWIASALTMEEAQQRFLAPLLALASRIAGEVDDRRASGFPRTLGKRSTQPETGLRQLGRTRGSHSEITGNNVNKPSSTRSATMNGVTPR